MATTTDVPAKFDIGIEGHGFMIDTQYLEAFRSRTIDPLRRQADASSSVGEASLNPEGFWRRSPESWHKGAGQSRYDASDSDPDRFFTSSGVDVWTEGQLSLLEATAVDQATPTTLALLSSVRTPGGAIAIEGSASDVHVFYATFASYRLVTTTQSDATDLTTDGTTVWVVDGGHLYSRSITNLEAGTGSWVAWITDDPATIAGVKYVQGRLLCVDTSYDLYDISATGLTTLPTALGSIEQASFGNFTAASANGYIYITSGGPIYQTTIKADGTGLEAPTIAAEVPSGESYVRMFGYLDFIVLYGVINQRLGGEGGLRMALAGADGALTLGETFLVGGMESPAFCGQHMETSGRFGYLPCHINPHNGGKGVVRLDFSTINDALVPAYAADVEITGSIVNLAAVASGEIYLLRLDGERWVTGDYLTSGVIQMGDVSFGTREPKQFFTPEDTTSAGSASHTLTVLTASGGTIYTDLDVATTEPSVTWLMTLTPTVSGDDMTVQYPILRALPAPAPLDEATIPLLLHRRVKDRNGQDVLVDTDTELDFLRGLRTTGGLIDFQDGGTLRSAQVTGVDWFASGERDRPGDQWDGMALVRMKVIPA